MPSDAEDCSQRLVDSMLGMVGAWLYRYFQIKTHADQKSNRRMDHEGNARHP